MERRAGVRRFAAALTGILLVAGCSGGGGSAAEEAGASGTSPAAAGRGGADPGRTSPSPGQQWDEADTSGAGSQGSELPLPGTTGQARKLARAVVAGPSGWGAGYVRDKPYKSGPDRTSRLDGDCVWQQEALRDDQLAQVTRRSKQPAADGDDALEVSAVVTVYRNVKGAQWSMARTLEDALRCPEQQLSGEERISGLASLAVPHSRSGATGDDSLDENGRLHRTGDDPQPYSWSQSRLGNVVLSAVVKGAPGHSTDEVEAAAPTALVHMLTKTRNELEADG